MHLVRSTLIAAVCVAGTSGCNAPRDLTPAPTPMPAPTPSLATFTFGGYVGDQSLSPVPFATVEVVGGPASGLSASTDNRGYYELTGPLGGLTTLTLRVSSSGYHTNTQTVTIPQTGSPACCANL